VSLLSRIGAALAVLRSGSGLPAAWFNRAMPLGGYNNEVTQPYAQSVWVQAAIKKIAKPISAVPLKFRDPKTEVEITNAPWLEFWKRPLKNFSRGDFLEALTGWLKLCGEGFILLPPELTVPFPDVQTQWPHLALARPESMKAIKGADGELIAWEHWGHKGQRTLFPLEQVIQPRYWNPYDPIRGMSEYEAARVATESDYLSGKFALNLARANGDTGIIISLKGGGVPGDDQQQQIREQLKQKAERARRGDFASILLPADLEVQDPKVRAPDAQFVAQRLENRHEIAIAFDVPPSMFEVMQSYSVGSASARYQLIEDACMPTGQKICEAISQIASRQAGTEVEAYLDWKEHSVMQQARNERIDSGTKLWDRGMPWEKVNEFLDLDLPRFEGDQTGYISFGLAPVGEAGLPENQPETDPKLAEEEETDPVKEALRAIRGVAATRQSAANVSGFLPKAATCEHCGNLDFSTLAIRANDSNDVKLWKSIVAKRRETIRAYESKFNAALMTARREVLQKLERAAESDTSNQKCTRCNTQKIAPNYLWCPNCDCEGGDPQKRAAAADFMFNLGDFTKVFQANMRQVGLNALKTSGDQLMKELKLDDPFTLPQAEAIQFLKNRENKLSGVPDDVYGRINSTIQDGLNDGDSLKQIANAVRGEFNEIGDKRARTIAATETAAAYGAGRHLAMEAAGVQWKQWLTSNNANVRSAHKLMNGVTLALDQKFIVLNPKTGETDEVEHPADPSGAPWNVINCHCVEIAVANGPEGEAEEAT
jgi:HK97 family phage portal protein